MKNDLHKSLQEYKKDPKKARPLMDLIQKLSTLLEQKGKK